MRNTSAMRVIIFLKMFKIENKIGKCIKKFFKMFLVFEILGFENVAIITSLRTEELSSRVNE